MFRIDRQSTVFHFSVHFRSPIIIDLQLRDQGLVDQPSIEPTLCQSNWLTADLDLQCCAKLPSMRCE